MFSNKSGLGDAGRRLRKLPPGNGCAISVLLQIPAPIFFQREGVLDLVTSLRRLRFHVALFVPAEACGCLP